MASHSGAGPRGVLRETVATGVPLGVALALVDLWQVALVSPGSLQPSGVAWLVGLYTAACLGGGLVTFGALRLAGRAAFPRRVPAARAFLATAGLALLAMEVGLQALEPLSRWRPWVAAAVGLVALGVWGAATVVFRTLRVPGWVGAAAAVLALVGGAFLAVRGLGPSPRPTTAAGKDVDASAERPNVIFILIDTLRADHLGAYGYARPTSPVLDALAAEGVLFENAFSQSSWTKPATASLLTSRYPSQHQCYLEAQGLPAGEVTLPQYLQRAGYTTAMLSGNPWITPDYGFDRGADYFYLAYDERFAHATLFMRTLKRLSALVDQKARPYNRLKRLVQGELSVEARDRLLTAEAVRRLERIERDQEEPFFLYLHYMSPHHPYDPPPPFDRFVPDPSLQPVTSYPRKSYYFFDEGEAVSDAQLRDMVARYDGDILHVDTLVGRLLDEVGRLGLRDDTLVVVTADHGEEFFDHRNWGHGQSIYNELIRVPLIVRFPAGGEAGRRVSDPVQTIDVLPTLLELAGVPLPAGIAGRSLLPVLRGEGDGPGEAYSELLYRYGDSRGLVAGERKLVRTARGEDIREELFDLAADPGEQHDLRAAPADAAALRRRLGDVVTWAETHKAPDAAEAAVGEDTRDHLRALGYAK